MKQGFEKENGTQANGASVYTSDVSPAGEHLPDGPKDRKKRSRKIKAVLTALLVFVLAIGAFAVTAAAATFTLTMGSGNNAISVTVHYTDRVGNEITPSSYQNSTVTFTYTSSVLSLVTYKQTDSFTSGDVTYTYDGIYLDDPQGTEAYYLKLSATTSGDEMNSSTSYTISYSTTEGGDYTTWNGETGVDTSDSSSKPTTTYDIYIVYSRSDDQDTYEYVNSTYTGELRHVDIRVEGSSSSTSSSALSSVSLTWEDESTDHTGATVTLYLLDADGGYITESDGTTKATVTLAYDSTAGTWSYTFDGTDYEGLVYNVEVASESDVECTHSYTVTTTSDTATDSTETSNIDVVSINYVAWTATEVTTTTITDKVVQTSDHLTGFFTTNGTYLGSTTAYTAGEAIINDGTTYYIYCYTYSVTGSDESVTYKTLVYVVGSQYTSQESESPEYDSEWFESSTYRATCYYLTTGSTIYVSLTWAYESDKTESDGETTYSTTYTSEVTFDDVKNTNTCATTTEQLMMSNGGDSSMYGYDAVVSFDSIVRSTASIVATPTAELEITKTVGALYDNTVVEYDSEDTFDFEITYLANPVTESYTLSEGTSSGTYTSGDYTVTASNGGYTLTVGDSSYTLSGSEGTYTYTADDGTLYTLTVTTEDDTTTYTLEVTTWPTTDSSGSNITYVAYVTDTDGEMVGNSSIGATEDSKYYGTVYTGLTVTLTAGETLHIVGLLDGAQYIITELGETGTYKTDSEEDTSENVLAAFISWISEVIGVDGDDEGEIEESDYTLYSITASPSSGMTADVSAGTATGSIDLSTIANTTYDYAVSLEYVNVTETKTVNVTDSDDNTVEDADGTTVEVGDVLTYTVLWVNNATSSTTDEDKNTTVTSADAKIVVTDTVPAGTELTSAAPVSIVVDGVTYEASETTGTDEDGNSCTDYIFKATIDDEETTLTYGDSANVTATVSTSTNDNGETVVTWTITNAPADSYGYVELVVTVTSEAVLEGEISNTASITVGENDPSYTTNEVTNTVSGKTVSTSTTETDEETEETTTTTQEAAGDLVSVGDNLTYTIAWANTEEDAATVTIEDSIPNGTKYVSASYLTIVYEGVTYTATGSNWSYTFVDESGNTLTYDGTNAVTATLTTTTDNNSTVTKVTWTITNAPAGSHGTVELVVIVTEDALENEDNLITNTASVKIGNNNAVEYSVTNSVPEKDVFATTVTETEDEDGSTTTTYTAGTVSINGQMVGVGDVLTYYIYYTNSTDEDATVYITDKIPTGTTYINGTAYPSTNTSFTLLDEDGNAVKDDDGNGITVDVVQMWDQSTRKLTWEIRGVPAGYSGYVYYSVTVEESAIDLDGNLIDNTASVSLNSDPSVDTNTVKNTVPEKTDEVVYDSDREEGGSNYYLSKGDIIEYTVSFEFDGYSSDGQTTTSATVVDKLSRGLEYFEGEAGNGSTYYAVIAITDADTGTVSYYVIQGTTTDGTTTYTVCSATISSNSTNSESESTVTIDGVTYVLGSSTSDITFSIASETETDGDDSETSYTIQTLTWVLSNLSAGDWVEISFYVMVNDESLDEVENSATVNGHVTNVTETPTNDVSTKDVYATTATTTDGVTTYSIDGDSIDGQTVSVGDVLVYVIEWVNTSDSTADVTIKDVIPAGLTVLSTEPAVGEGGITVNSDGTTTVTYTQQDVAAGGKGTFYIYVEVIGDVTTLENSALVNGVSTNTVTNYVPDKEQTNEELDEKSALEVGDVLDYELTFVVSEVLADATDGVTVIDTLAQGLHYLDSDDTEYTDEDGNVYSGQSVIVEVQSESTVTIRSAVSEDSSETYTIEAGDELTYSISYTNSTSEAADIVITTTLPSGITIDATSLSNSAKVTTNSDGTVTITWTLSEVSANTSGTVSFTATATNANSATVTATYTVGDDTTSNTSTVTVTKDIYTSTYYAFEAITGEDGSVTYTAYEVTYDEESGTYSKVESSSNTSSITYTFTETTAADLEDSDVTNEVLIWIFSGLSEGDIVTITFHAVVTSESLAQVDNSFTVNGDQSDTTETPTDTESSKSVSADTDADGEIDIEDADGSLVGVGTELTYTINWANGAYTTDKDGNVTYVAANVIVTDTVPDGTELVIETAEDGTISIPGITESTGWNASTNDGGDTVYTGEIKDSDGNHYATVTYNATTEVITWDLGSRKAGEKGTVSFTVVVTKDAVNQERYTYYYYNESTGEWETTTQNVENTIVNQAKVTYTYTVGESSTQQYTYTNEVTNEVPEKDVVAGDSDDDGDYTDETSIDTYDVAVGDVLTYVITFTNTEDEPATVTVTDSIPAGTTYVKGSASYTTNIVSKDNNRDYVTDEDGNYTSTSTTVTGESDNSISYDSESETLTWTITDVAPGASVTVTFQVTVTTDALSYTSINNTASVAIGNDSAVSTNTVTNTTEDKTVWANQDDDTSTDGVDVDGDLVSVGDVLTYTIRWENSTGNTADITITDKIPTGTEYVSGSAAFLVISGTSYTISSDGTTITNSSGTTVGSIDTSDSSKIVWKITDVPNGAYGTVTFQVTVLDSAATQDSDVTNQATISVGNSYSYTTDSTTNDVPAKSVVEYDTSTGSATDDNNDVQVGDVLQYSITVVVPEDVTSITITDSAPEGTTYVENSMSYTLMDASGTELDASTYSVTTTATVRSVTWVIAPNGTNSTVIPEGTVITVSFRVTVTESALTNGDSTTNDDSDDDIITNDATVTIGEGSSSYSVTTNEVTTELETGNLTISKTVDADTENTGVEDSELANVEFNFTLTLKDSAGNLLTGTYAYTGDGTVTGGTTTDDTSTITIGSDGQVTLILKAGEYITFLDLPEGATYGVTESTATYYTTTSSATITTTSEDGTTSSAEYTGGSIVAGETVTVAFTNKYKPESVTSGSIPVVKTISGRDWDEDDAFTFVLTQSDENGNILTNDDNETTYSQTITITKSNYDSTTESYTNSFQEITYSAAGTYYYVITENAGTSSRLEYSGAKYLVTVVVAYDSSTGGLKVDSVTITQLLDDDGETSASTESVTSAAFTNTYTPDATPEKDVYGTTVIEGEDGTTYTAGSASIDGELVGVGDYLTYVITWKNDAVDSSGAAAAAKITIVDTIPSGTSFASLGAITIGETTYELSGFTQNSDGSYTLTTSDGVTVTISLSEDESGSTVITWVINQAAANATGTVSFIVQVESNAVNETDNEISNTAKVQVGNGEYETTNEVTNYVPEKTESTDPDSIEVGDQLSYEITFLNTEADATATVVDVLDSGLTYVTSGDSADSTSVTIVGADGTSQTAIYVETYDGNTSYTYPVYTLTYDTESNTLTWTIYGLSEGDTVTVIFTATVNENAGEVVTNSATVNGSSTNIVTTPAPKKSVSVSDSEGNVTGSDGSLVGVGDVLTYTITYANGEVSDAVVAITDSVPDGTTFESLGSVSVTINGTGYEATSYTESEDGSYIYTIEIGESDSITVTVTIDGDDLTWVVSSVPSGAVGAVSYSVTVTEDAVTGNPVENTATVKVGENPAKTTNTVSNPTPVKTVTSDTDDDGEQENVDGTSSVEVGDVLTFTIEFTADSSMTGSVDVIDTLDEGLTFKATTSVTVDGEAISSGTLSSLAAALTGSEAYTESVDGQTITWTLKNLTSGQKVVITFTATVTSTSDGKIENTATVGGHSTNTNTVTVDTGNLTLTKKVTGTDATDKVFTFTITLNPAVSETYSFTGTVTEATVTNDEDGGTTTYKTKTYTSDSPGSITFTNGVATVYLKAGESITILDLPAGATYTVTETNIPSGYSLSTESSALTGKISADSTVSVTATNTYTLSGTSDTLTATKTTEGFVQSGGEFTFVLVDSSGNVVATATNNSDGEIEFSVSFEKEGTYVYTVYERYGTDGSYTYDRAVYTVTYVVTDGGEGVLVYTKTIVSTTSTGEVDEDDIVFTNSYNPESLSVSISGLKVIQSDYSRTPQTGEFTFTLTEVNKNDETVSGGISQTVTNTGGGFTFEDVYTFTEPGTKYFKVTEDAGTDGTMTYDTTVYYVKVVVTYDEETNTLSAAYYYSKDGTNYTTLTGASNLTFTNEYNPGDNTKDVFYASDTTTSIDGEYVNAGDTLEYQIYWVNDAVDEESGANAAATVYVRDTIPDGTTYVSGSASSVSGSVSYALYDASGNALSDTTENASSVAKIVWTISAEAGEKGTVSFRVTVDESTLETITNKGTVQVGENGSEQSTNTTTNYKTVKTVTDSDGNAAAEALVGETLTYTISYRNMGKAEATITIEDAIPDGTVYVEGSATGADGSVSGIKVSTTTNARTGEVTSITWTITVAAGVSGTVSFDVTVTEDAVDTSIANQATVKIGDNEYETNEVTTEVSGSDLTISKTVTGTFVYDNQEFTFTITATDANENPLTGTYKTKDKDDTAGTITFVEGSATVTLKNGESITILDLPEGTQYTVTETAVDGYETTVNGTETYEVSGTIKESVTGSAAFTNEYVSILKEPVGTEGLFYKVLTGRDWTDEDSFTFILTPADQSNPMPSGSETDEDGNVYKSVTVTAESLADGAASFDFGSITFTEEDMDGAELVNGHYQKTFTYYVVEKNAGKTIDGITYSSNVATLTITVVDNGEGNLNATAAVTVGNGTFTNKYKSKLDYSTAGGLYITKTLNGRDLEAGQFKFTITAQDSTNVTAANAASALFGDDYDEETYSKTFTNTAAKDGKTSYILVLEGLALTYDEDDAGNIYSYTVEETTGGGDGYTNDETKYTVTIEIIDNGDGTITSKTTVSDGADYSKTYTYTTGDEYKDVSSGQIAVIPFTNYYGATTTLGPDGEVQIKATKTLTGRDQTAGEFSFIVKDSDGETVATGTNDADGNITFSNIVYTTSSLKAAVEAGTAVQDGDAYIFNYTVYEVTDSLASGVSAGTYSFGITVTVTDNGDGTLKATVTYPDGYEDGLEFTNYYQTNSVDVVVNGRKFLETAKDTLTTSIADIEGLFTFTISAIGDNAAYAPLPSSTTASNDAAGNISFGTITFDLDDLVTVANAEDGVIVYDSDGNRTVTFTYQVTESGTVSGVTNDTNARTFSVTITEYQASAELTYVTVSASTIEGSLFNFKNTYDVTSVTTSITDQLSITKELDGRDLSAGEFTFYLVEIEDDGSASVVASGTNDADGKVTMSSITYYEPGEYDYTLYETNSGAGGVDYSAVVYWVHTSITDNGDGTLKVVHTFVNSDGTTFESVTYENTYTAQPTSVTLGAAKVYTDGTLEAGQFLFRLVGSDGVIYSEVANDMNGSVLFDTITYTEAGTYEYTIFEVIDGQENVTYDTTVHTVTVVVTDDGEGQLYAQIIYDGDAANTAPIFTNVYEEPEPEPEEEEEIEETPAVKTGDLLNVMLLLGMMFILSGGVGGLLALDRRMRRRR